MEGSGVDMITTRPPDPVRHHDAGRRNRRGFKAHDQMGTEKPPPAARTNPPCFRLRQKPTRRSTIPAQTLA